MTQLSATPPKRMKPPRRLTPGCHFALIAALGLCGCARTADSTDLTSLGKAAAVVNDHSQSAFLESNRLIRRVSADRFIRSGDIALTDDKFQILVTPQAAADWQAVLSAMERYGALLGSLTRQSRGAATSDAIGGLANELNQGVVGASISPGVGAAIASLAGALVQARAERDARRILRATDPAFRATIEAMADAIGADESSGLRGTVRTNWEAALDESRRPYLTAAGDRNEAAQRRLVADYLAATDRRDAQLRTLADLRVSIVALGTAHAAAASGSPRSVDALLDAISHRAAETQRLYDMIDGEERK